MSEQPLNALGMTTAARKTMFYLFDLVSHYRIFDPATEQARRDLASRGIEVDIIDPISPDGAHHIGKDGKPVTWLQWWRTHH